MFILTSLLVLSVLKNFVIVGDLNIDMLNFFYPLFKMIKNIMDAFITDGYKIQTNMS